jgi:hypothetical protein
MISSLASVVEEYESALLLAFSQNIAFRGCESDEQNRHTKRSQDVKLSLFRLTRCYRLDVFN